MSVRPTVVDLFCGGGGFSEGFRRAGFDVVFAADKDGGACDTYRLNHPETEVRQADVAELTVDDLPEVDILIGSPPCTEFSWSKQGGGGDIDQGMRLVGEFLRLVIELDPEYWIMENVPRLDEYLDQEISFERIPSLKRDVGDIVIPQKEVLDASDYRTPQRRERLFSGDFPVPSPVDGEALTLGEIQDHFPHPIEGPDPEATVEDPSYDIGLPEPDLTDHFYNTFLTERDTEETRRQKEDHSFYGPMSFPDDLEAAARTVIATNRRVARETLVLEEDEALDGFSHYRKPTIREIASIQGFPITYQFSGSSVSKKWRRVGDAVPPSLSFEIANAIRQEMGLEQVVEERTTQNLPETNLNDEPSSKRRGRTLNLNRQFRHHVPMDNMQEFRVDIETDKDLTPPHPFSSVIEEDITHPVGFRVHLYRGYAEEVEETLVDLDMGLEPLENISCERFREPTVRFLEALNETFGSTVPDATTLQAVRARRYGGEAISPSLDYDLLDRIADLVDTHFDFFGAREWRVACPEFFGDPTSEEAMIPARILMKLIAANYVVWKLNEGVLWVIEHPDDLYLVDDWPIQNEDRDTLVRELSKRDIPDEQLHARLADFRDRFKSG